MSDFISRQFMFSFLVADTNSDDASSSLVLLRKDSGDEAGFGNASGHSDTHVRRKVSKKDKPRKGHQVSRVFVL